MLVPILIICSCSMNVGIYIKYARLVRKYLKNKPEVNRENETECATTDKTSGLKTSSEITPLLNAIISNDIPLVKKIIESAPGQINIIYSGNGNTPLHVAAFNGHTEIVRLLLAQPNIDTTILNQEQKTAFDIATEKGYTEISSLLK